MFPCDFEYLLYMFPGIRSKRLEGVETTNMVAQEERTILKEVNTMPTTFCSIFLGLKKSTIFFLLLNACIVANFCEIIINNREWFFSSSHLYRQRHSSFFSAISLNFFSFSIRLFFTPSCWLSLMIVEPSSHIPGSLAYLFRFLIGSAIVEGREAPQRWCLFLFEFTIGNSIFLWRPAFFLTNSKLGEHKAPLAFSLLLIMVHHCWGAQSSSTVVCFLF